MLIESIVISILVSLKKGGNLRRLEDLHLKLIYLPLLAGGIELISSWILKTDYHNMRAVVQLLTFEIHILIYLLLGLFINYNYHIIGFKWVALGTGMNFLVIAMNRGFMPVSYFMAEQYGAIEMVRELQDNLVFGHKILEITRDKFVFLADLINIPPPYPFPRTISIGDIFISLGVYVLLRYYLTERTNEELA